MAARVCQKYRMYPFGGMSHLVLARGGILLTEIYLLPLVAHNEGCGIWVHRPLPRAGIIEVCAVKVVEPMEL
jgi:hypothetical protein